jgi:16S rRNA G966 N2-methylase RsmD
VVRGEVLRELPRMAARGERFELVFADPPYAGPEVDRVVAAFGAADACTGDARTGVVRLAGLLADGGVLVVEHAARRPPPVAAAGLSLVDTRRYGDSAVTFYIPSSGDPSGDP